MDSSFEPSIDLARAAFAQGHHTAAELWFRDVLAAGLDDAEVRHHLGFLARQRGDLDEAAAHYADALEHAPADPHLYHNLAEVRASQGHLAEAVALLRRSLSLAPDAVAPAVLLGGLLLRLKRPDLAYPLLLQATTQDPGQLQALAEMAICLCSMNRYPEALVVYRRMYRTLPGCGDARYMEALALLALGDFENGWRKHEARWYAQIGQPMRRVMAGPYWTGEDDLRGRTILVHAEQGFGDTVQFLRYIPLLRERADTVILEVQVGLGALLADVPDVYQRGDVLPPYDTHCSFMSLPFAFRTTRATIPAAVPYLTVPADRVANWADRLEPPDGRRRIAVAWTGASAVWNRSIPVALLEPLFRRTDCVFHVVQTQMEDGDRAFLEAHPEVVDLSAGLEDFADTAAAVALMDMVISVDTVLAHLGGALAKPVWTLLPFGAEYRWMTEGTTTPWYPTMRLFRQPALFDWPAVVAQVGRMLDAWAIPPG